MIIYTDSNVAMFGNEGTQLTPAHTYATTSNFANILDDLAKGNIPCGTGQPFPVNWKTETNNNNPPWINRTNYPQTPPGGFVNPFSNSL